MVYLVCLGHLKMLSSRKRVYGKRSRSLPKYKKKSKKEHVPRSLQVATSSYRGVLNTSQKSSFIYHEEFTVNPGVGGTPADYVFSCNGLFDPNITGVGHQPRGFDQLIALYDHYVVIAAKIFATFATTDPGGDGNMVGVVVKDIATALTTPDNIMESRVISYGGIGGETNGPPVTIELQINPNQFLGRSKPLSDNQLKGSSAANPVEQCYFHVFGFPCQSGRDSSGIQVQVRIEYEAILIEPKQPGAS